jgi:lysozyme
MRPRLSVSRSAVELIMAFEGFRAKAAQLDDGRWTVGYGHTATARAGAEISQADAEALLLYDLIQAAHAVNEHVYAPLNQNQFDALVSFAFNIGARAFKSSPTVRRLNEGRLLEAALAMELWRKADLEGERIVIDALVRRRAAEKALFLKPVDGWIPAPTPVLQPKMDYDALGLIPLTTPVEARATLDGERAHAERAPVPPPPSDDDSSASEAAAQAVIDRLQSLLGEPATGGASAAEPRAETSAAPAAQGATQGAASQGSVSQGAASHGAAEAALFVPTGLTVGKPRRRWLAPVVVVLLGALGVGLLALAAIWGFQPGAEHVLGVSPRTAGLTIGLAGVICFGVAAYFMLERLGAPRESVSR